MLRLALAVGLSLLAAEPGSAAGIRVRWQPTQDARVTGYNVYVRAAGKPYAAPVDARMPVRQSDGTMVFVVSGLVAGANYYVGLTAYGAERQESALSPERPLAGLQAVDPCRRDVCTSPRSCQFSTEPNGTACDDWDLCRSCQDAVCRVGTTLPFSVRRIRVVGANGEGHVRASGFLPLGDLAPVRNGVGLSISDPGNGKVVFEAFIPGEVFNRDPGARILRIVDKTFGNRLMVRLVQLGDRVRMSVRASTPDIAALLPLLRLTWTVRMPGQGCAQSTVLVCNTTERFALCR